MVRWMGRRWWDGGEVRHGHRPDQQDGTGGVVDDESAGRAQALGSKVGAVAVAGHDEQIGACGGSDDFPVDASRPFHPAAPASQAFSGGVEELGGEGSAEVFQAGAGITVGVAAAEQTGVGAVRDAGCVGAAYVQQDKVGVGGGVPAGGIDAGRPGTFDNPDNYGQRVSAFEEV